jgi:hypothetical protein
MGNVKSCDLSGHTRSPFQMTLSPTVQPSGDTQLHPTTYSAKVKYIAQLIIYGFTCSSNCTLRNNDDNNNKTEFVLPYRLKSCFTEV